ncbi:hypothetical protein PoB_005316500 [Plakobranchus ocellatus]|uniref:Uncharacterized protein n=1 Tax=Plakobranchus ocellatus TaxID=259542 RepID=A0AAV4C4V3_9GAST|nr:hypothetical protein PoB_005316500 [Plakobranchus ocellatus]
MTLLLNIEESRSVQHATNFMKFHHESLLSLKDRRGRRGRRSQGAKEGREGIGGRAARDLAPTSIGRSPVMSSSQRSKEVQYLS